MAGAGVSTPDTFRDALAAVLAEGWPNPTADAVLASDEMQAIRATLSELASTAVSHIGFDGAAKALSAYSLPDHLIAWVLDDPSPDGPPPADKPRCARCGDTGRVTRLLFGEFSERVCPSCRGGEPQ